MEFLPKARQRNDETLDLARPEMAYAVNCESDTTDLVKPGALFNVRDDRIGSGDLLPSVSNADSRILLSRPAKIGNKFPRKHRPKITKICPCCKKKFITTIPSKIFISDAHRKRFDRERMRTKEAK